MLRCPCLLWVSVSFLFFFWNYIWLKTSNLIGNKDRRFPYVLCFISVSVTEIFTPPPTLSNEVTKDIRTDPLHQKTKPPSQTRVQDCWGSTEVPKDTHRWAEDCHFPLKFLETLLLRVLRAFPGPLDFCFQMLLPTSSDHVSAGKGKVHG